MRFATWELDGIVSAGVVSADDRLHPVPDDMSVLELVQAGLPAALEIGAVALSSPGIPLTAVRLLPPLAAPTVRDFIAFEQHVEGTARAVGVDAGVVPEWYEADHVFGYTILNDWSARDLQRREMKVLLGPAKGKDFATTLGPWLVTVDELESFRDDQGFLDLEMNVSVNGREAGRDRLSNMGWTFEDLISYASRGTWVKAGDVIGSGTCGGGCLAELWGRNGSFDPPPLRPGDVVEMSVEVLGTIRNRVVPGVADLQPVAPARSRRQKDQQGLQ